MVLTEVHFHIEHDNTAVIGPYALQLDKIQKIEVVASRYFFGPVISDGIVSCTTYKGNLDGYTLNPHDLVVDYDGLQQQRIFY